MDNQEIDKNIQEKMAKLAREKFTEQACLDFFGGLNILEIKRLLELFENNEIKGIPEKGREFLLAYLYKLKEKLEEKIKEEGGD